MEHNLPPTYRHGLTENRLYIFIALCAFVLGALFCGGLFALFQSQQSDTNVTGLRESDISKSKSGYSFIDPLIAIKGDNNSDKYSTMENAVATYVAAEKQHGLQSVSVYFRDITASDGFSYNPTELYVPASLNKIPLMMAYLKLSEEKPDVLMQVITYSGERDSNKMEEIKSVQQLVPGAQYTVMQLIEHMIRYSDNNATDLLTQHLVDINDVMSYPQVFSDLGVDPIVLTKYTDSITAQQYSIFLRSLYNATYLNRTDSEHALRLLSETDFSDGIESGIPNHIVVAQKFGEVRMTDSSGTLLGKEINNCGIVYFPEHHYLLCIMTKKSGDDVVGLESEIASISRIVYKNMQKLYPQ